MININYIKNYNLYLNNHSFNPICSYFYEKTYVCYYYYSEYVVGSFTERPINQKIHNFLMEYKSNVSFKVKRCFFYD